MSEPLTAAYRSDHKSAQAADWAHVPLAKDRKQFDEMAAQRDQVALLLDANRDASYLVPKILGDERAASLGRLSRQDGRQVLSP